MAEWTFNQEKTKEQLIEFFADHSEELRKFGSTVNQTFEAFVFASTLQWYRDNGWKVKIMDAYDRKLKRPVFKLKFSTNGEPENFSYATAFKGNQLIQIRHQLRVATASHSHDGKNYANVCLDIAVIKNKNLRHFKSFFALDNKDLITFGEAKHMSGYAELVAGFIGLVHEMQPDRLKFHETPKRKARHPKPFLFLSGVLYKTGAGVEHTIRMRKFDIEVHTSAKSLSLRQHGGGGREL